MQSVFAQQPTALFEFGGGYHSTKSSTNPTQTNQSVQNTSQTKEPTLFGKVGFFVSSKSVIGGSFLNSRIIQEQSSYSYSNAYNYESFNENRDRSNAYGVFYRYYFKPFLSESRWNFFAEANPALLRGKEVSTSRTRSWSNDTPGGSNNSTIEASTRHVGFNIHGGVSYRIVAGLSAQLSLYSIVHAQSESGDGPEKTRSFNIFKDPLRNTLLSLTYHL